MANSKREPYKPTIATMSQLEALEKRHEGLEAAVQDAFTKVEAEFGRMTDIVAAFGTRLAITEHAMSGIIQDLYYTEEAEADDELDEAEEAADIEHGEPESDEDTERRRLHENVGANDDGSAGQPTVEDDVDRVKREFEEAKAKAEADWESDGGAFDGSSDR